MKKLLCALLLLFSLSAAARGDRQSALDYSMFSRLPVLDQGRVKPLESFARGRLKIFSDRERAGELRAAAWLAETLFDPAQSAARPVFYIGNEESRRLLALPENQTLFSFAQLQDGLALTAEKAAQLRQAEEKNLTAAQRDLLALHENAAAYAELLRSFSLLLPLDVEVPPDYGPPAGTPPSWLALAGRQQALTDTVKTIVAAKGEDPEHYNEEERKAAMLAWQLRQVRAGGEGSAALRVMPVTWTYGEEWLSPWQLVLQGRGSPQSAAYLDQWAAMARAYRTNDAAAWKAAAAKAAKTMAPVIESHPFEAEIFYGRVKPFRLALAAGALAALCAAGSLFAAPLFLRRAGLVFLGGGALAAGAGIALRVVILQRPPVGTLYESVIFVAFLVAALAAFAGIRKTNAAALLAGALAALGLLGVAPVLAPAGEDMEMLAAVLNTNFWLATHVLCITAGYGLCILTAGLAHFYMAARAFPAASLAAPESVYGLMYRFSLAALLFTALGTALGGIWADQSWGRFWGWDPKENGALLIVLWLVWVQHGRIGGYLRPLPFAAGLAALNIIVALAWFGVNLLGTGLHSYGFTSGIAAGLGAFCAAELLLIGGLWMLTRKTGKERHA